MFGRFLPYLACCFWLVVPVLIIDGLFTSSLPPAFQPDSFWRDIPAALAWPENVFRFAVIALTIVLPLPLTRLGERPAGLALYLLGLVAYALAWLAVIAWPASGWSLGAIGFSAPAWTPLLWLGGIGLIARGPLLERFRFILPLYWVIAIGFVGFHLSHTLTVFARLAV
jgi:hypothetical protein